MMMKINTYLTFNGNCRQAMEFYHTCFGGELDLQLVGQSPMASKLPERMRDQVLHGSLVNGELNIMGSDMVGEDGLIRGNTVSMMLNCRSEEEIKRLYQLLAEGGQATHPLENTFWGAIFGDLTDRYGNQWLLHFEKNTDGHQKEK